METVTIRRHSGHGHCWLNCGDHVHILFRAKFTTDLVTFINTAEGATVRWIRNEYADKLKTIFGATPSRTTLTVSS